jgi:hypothetical protein
MWRCKFGTLMSIPITSLWNVQAMFLHNVDTHVEKHSLT